MNLLNSNDTNFFKQKGYIVIKNQISEEVLKKLHKNSKEIINEAINIKWPHVRVYRDYPHFFGKPNIFGIDYPFSKMLGKTLFEVFNSIKIDDFIKELGNFENFETELIRLHTNSSFFKYQGGWHRDFATFSSPGYLTCIIYLEDEKGFKIVTNEKNELLAEYGVDSNFQSNLTVKDSFISLPKNMYDVVDVNKGDILFFKPGLLHQGYCKKYRLHYHMRFKKIEGDTTKQNMPFNFVKDFLPDTKIDENIGTYNYSKSLRSRIKRLKSFILYFFPRIKSLIYNIFSKKKKLSIFHSTIWQ